MMAGHVAVVVTPMRADLGPRTGRRPVISQVTLVWFPSNTQLAALSSSSSFDDLIIQRWTFFQHRQELESAPLKLLSNSDL